MMGKARFTLGLLLTIQVALAPGLAAARLSGEVAVTGSATIDGSPVTTGATLYSGSRMTTESGATAIATIQGSRVTLGEETDAIFTFVDGALRVDVICGTASAVAASGTKIEIITHDDTSVYVQSGTLRVIAEGRSTEMVENQTQSYVDSAQIIAVGPTGVEASTLLCSCKCAPAESRFPWWLTVIVGPTNGVRFIFGFGPTPVSPFTFG